MSVATIFPAARRAEVVSEFRRGIRRARDTQQQAGSGRTAVAVEELGRVVDAAAEEQARVARAHVDREHAGLGRLVQRVARGLLERGERGRVGELRGRGPLLALLRERLPLVRHRRDRVVGDARRRRGRRRVARVHCVGARAARGRRAGRARGRVRGDRRLVRREHRARLVALAHQPRYHAARRVVLVQRLRELLARVVEVRLERVRLEHERVPLVLERREQARQRRRVRRARPHAEVALHRHQVLGRERLPRDGARAARRVQVLRGEGERGSQRERGPKRPRARAARARVATRLLNQVLLEQVARELADDRLARHLTTDRTEERHGRWWGARARRSRQDHRGEGTRIQRCAAQSHGDLCGAHGGY